MRVRVVVIENEDGRLTGIVPAMPGCVTEGKDRQELLANLREALEGCLLVEAGTYEPIKGGRAEEIDL
jgi:predicted RNase H-like HicB family nuclease